MGFTPGPTPLVVEGTLVSVQDKDPRHVSGLLHVLISECHGVGGLPTRPLCRRVEVHPVSFKTSEGERENESLSVVYLTRGPLEVLSL